MSKIKKIQLIIKTPSGTKGPDAIFKQLKSLDKHLDIKQFVEVKSVVTKKTKTTELPKQFIVESSFDASEIKPWEFAHVANEAAPSIFAEPDDENEFIVQQKNVSAKSLKNKDEKNIDFDPDWMPHENKIWHLSDQYSQLLNARKQVENLPGTITIAHFDTGYDPNHFILPKHLNKKYQRNFIEGENANNAEDIGSDGFLKMPGHGTGTIGILAGNIFKTEDGKFNDELGGASFAEVVPFRIAKSVVLIRTSAFAQALNHITNLTLTKEKIFHVLTMSMGGSASQAWADAVNAAYEAGITLVSAAGNHFNGLPTDHLIYPARFNRVIAACGVTYENKPYRIKKLGEMQGCYGPKKFMKTAMAAYTPNLPWAKWGKNSISFAGAGTSSATPQVASAAAIYYKKNKSNLDLLLPWQRVEAIRYALFQTAKKSGEKSFETFGNGILQTARALEIPIEKSKLVMSEKDDVGFFPELNVIFKSKKPTVNKQAHKMYDIEMAQIVHSSKELQKLLHQEEKSFIQLNKKEKKIFVEHVINMREPSQPLKNFLQQNIKNF